MFNEINNQAQPAGLLADRQSVGRRSVRLDAVISGDTLSMPRHRHW
ncbi:hypothetical protein QEG23_004073 [Stenotrophomonas maltophilia]|uniref:Uncharacterized protein n=1 Tax=Stenotrophomonas maltophilia TaxID=40324 RepID=A0AAI9C5B5_STEMA|nr:hypothetical protein [Stenotrophomonas maltophilia]HEL4103570.1 hypothetical protein [Stenotrophomonas maltophilia]